MVEAPALERWFALEMTRFHRAFVAQPRAVGDLVLESDPSAPTKGGELHRYDIATLQSIHAALGPLARRRVRLPATFFVEKEIPADAHVADEGAMELLRALGEVPADAAAREGKLWMGLARAKLVAQRYPGAFQFVYY